MSDEIQPPSQVPPPDAQGEPLASALGPLLWFGGALVAILVLGYCTG